MSKNSDFESMMTDEERKEENRKARFKFKDKICKKHKKKRNHSRLCSIRCLTLRFNSIANEIQSKYYKKIMKLTDENYSH